MGLLDKLFKKEVIKQPEPGVKEETKPSKPKTPRKPKVKKPKIELSEKEKATQAGEPYVNIIRMDVDPDDVNNGAFELDWNDKFVLNLIRAGYKYNDKDTEQDIVDRWFQTICRNVALEMYEQTQADPTNRDVRPIRTRDIGNGRTEVS
jgi:hypothetical protein